MDTNHDGVIDRDEWQRFRQGSSVPHRPAIAAPPPQLWPYTPPIRTPFENAIRSMGAFDGVPTNTAGELQSQVAQMRREVEEIGTEADNRNSKLQEEVSNPQPRHSTALS